MGVRRTDLPLDIAGDYDVAVLARPGNLLQTGLSIRGREYLPEKGRNVHYAMSWEGAMGRKRIEGSQVGNGAQMSV
ncbi:hypothetical protein CSU32_24475 [Salmonella enterica subsp. diarizonae]|nr:hypothetical protein [Salmonella enterica subsp. diarizonae]ECI3362772.1 hypothetical protein [Salmonella enterica subsp. diarizonae]